MGAGIMPEKTSGKFTDASGTKLYYEVLNPQGRITVAFFNGVMASVNSWSAQAALFARLGFRVVLHDFKGQLLSDKPDCAYSFADHAESALQLFAWIGVQKPHIVGTSYGGEIALRLAMDYPDLPASISVIDSAASLDERGRAFIQEWRRLALAGDAERFFRAMLPTIYGEQYLAANRELLERKALAMRSLDASWLTAQVRLYDAFFDGVEMESGLSAVCCPALVVCGEDDVLKTPEQSRRIARAITGAEFVMIPDCGHVTILERPDALNSVLLGFITKHSGDVIFA